ncbi:hypothetical protein BS50DRAFT_21029 [Corynespora cassiicola Philippines]|uniref:Uncharacterized protein n=1 Tax=Corynespora cassiicola Philippines TaxID=1448308 RepID=A0A2T2PAH4_CORCC|nr:hypothetical protein BS50DRAFT_21029 [Corynespora cassiicola Philippines]
MFRGKFLAMEYNFSTFEPHIQTQSAGDIGVQRASRVLFEIAIEGWSNDRRYGLRCVPHMFIVYQELIRRAQRRLFASDHFLLLPRSTTRSMLSGMACPLGPQLDREASILGKWARCLMEIVVKACSTATDGPYSNLLFACSNQGNALRRTDEQRCFMIPPLALGACSK